MLQPALANPPLDLRPPRVLVVGDEDGQVEAAMRTAAPDVVLAKVSNMFDALAELQGNEFAAVLVGTEPLEHRVEAAVRSLRAQLTPVPGARRARLLLFGGAAHEPIARQAINCGADDFLLLPADALELREALRPPAAPAAEAPTGEEPRSLSLLPADLPVGSIALDALVSRSGAALPTTVERINALLPTAVKLEIVEAAQPKAESVATPLKEGDPRLLMLHVPRAADEADRQLALHDLQELAMELAKLAELDARHLQLQRLALTDDLTGCYNRRYFRHFLEKIIAKARTDRFPVTLLLFDIDDFKHYNDRHGHGIGDAILQQTAELIKRVVRDHDLVARIGGDEFAVVFWETEGPRVPHDPAAASGARFPPGPLAIANRFRRLMSEPDFFALGPQGKGTLTISGGMAVFPFDAQTAEELIEAADRALIFGSKQSGKNSISLVGADPGSEVHPELHEEG